MSNGRLVTTADVAIANLAEFLQVAAHQSWPIHEEQVHGPSSYRVALGQVPIQLGVVEFRILLFLASKPYHAFTRRSIAAPISTAQHPIAEEMIDGQVASLLEQLRIFHDYVQSIPFIGYRFKA